MQIKAVLFDLDGTLLPMDQDSFVREYVGGLARTAAKYGFDPSAMARGIQAGTVAMFKNNGEKTNEQRFWDAMTAILGDRVYAERALFDEFYETDFDGIRTTCGFAPRSREIIDLVKGRGYRVILATNPLFPAVATAHRIKWAGLDPADFELVTSYEASRFCKPSLDYYREILGNIGLAPEECLMIGNDVDEDLIASRLGMRVFLLTDGILNRSGTDYTAHPHGNTDALIEFLNTLESWRK